MAADAQARDAQARDGQWRHLTAGCDDAQYEAIVSDAAPLLVVAGAGSGKTRVLTRRIARRIADGSASSTHVLALTFTRKAAGELRQRIAALGLDDPVTAGTFHAIALAELRRRAIDRNEAPPVVLGSKARLLARLLPDRYALDGGHSTGARASGRTDVLAQLANEIEWAKARCLNPGDYAQAAHDEERASALDVDLVVELYAAYEREKRKRRVLDVDDLLAALATAIADEPDFAAGQRWRFRHLFVDEFQDANPAQLRLLDAWLAGRTDLCAVGDPRQAIYGWNGADLGAIDGFVDRYPGATVIHLDANYRSTPQIVAVARAALAKVAGVGAGVGSAVAGGGSAGAGSAGAGSAVSGGAVSGGAVGPDGSVPTVTAYPDERAEAEGVVRIIRRTSPPGQGWSHAAILARTNAQLDVFAQILEVARIPFRTGAGSGFLARPTVREALSVISDPGLVGQFVAFVDDLELQLRGDELTPEQAEELAALARLARDFCSDEARPTLDGFVTWSRTVLRSDSAPGVADGVTLATFHRAKGLEWRTVFVTGLEEGLVPITQARTTVALAEERRLLYVAMSRAEAELHCSWSRTRTYGSRTVERSPSRFLAAVEAQCRALEIQSVPDRDAARRAIAQSRASLAKAQLG